MGYYAVNTFKAGDRFVYVGKHPVYFSLDKMGLTGTVQGQDYITKAGSGMVRVLFDSKKEVYTLYSQNIERVPLDGEQRDGSVWIKDRWHQIVPRPTVRGDLVSCSVFPKAQEPPDRWESINIEYGDGRIQVSIPPRYAYDAVKRCNYLAEAKASQEHQRAERRWRENDALKARMDLVEKRYDAAQAMYQTVSNVSVGRYKKIKELEERIEGMSRAAELVRGYLDSMYSPEVESQANTFSEQGK